MYYSEEVGNVIVVEDVEVVIDGRIGKLKADVWATVSG